VSITYPLPFVPSGSFTFSVYRDQIIRAAMLVNGILEPSEVPTAQEIVDCAAVLNMITKQLAGQLDKAPGFKMWQRYRGHLFLGASKYVYQLGGTSTDNWAGGVTGLPYPNLYQQNQLVTAVNAGGNVLQVGIGNTTAVNVNDYIGVQVTLASGVTDIFWSTVSSVNTLTGQVTMATGLPSGSYANSTNYVWNYTTPAQRPMKVLTALLRDITFNDTPLTEMTLEQYEALPTKTMPTNVADPTAWYYEARMIGNQGHLYTDCAGAQDVTKGIHAVFLRESMDFVNPLDAPEYPQEWFWHLVWSLALPVCSMFDGDWTEDRKSNYLLATSQAREGNPQVTAQYFQPEDDDQNY
jgi:hypothetical protein